MFECLAGKVQYLLAMVEGRQTGVVNMTDLELTAIPDDVFEWPGKKIMASPSRHNKLVDTGSGSYLSVICLLLSFARACWALEAISRERASGFVLEPQLQGLIARTCRRARVRKCTDSSFEMQVCL